MPEIAYKNFNFRPDTLALIDQANEICQEYQDQGYSLTLRQLYYQFVARGYIPNRQTEYKRLGSIVNDARLAGLMDWDYIVDRTRNLQSLAHWDSPEAIIEAVSQQFRHNLWENQDYHVEVWVEKDALVGVIGATCERNDVPYFSCRGYTSQSELWGAAQRLIRCEKNGQATVVIHLGDHDPSGIDMTRDIQDRLALFGSSAQVQRIALTMDQVNQYDPPPNPAKLTDSRVTGYMAEYGDESWELDALAPDVLDNLIQAEIEVFRNEPEWERAQARQEEERQQLVRVYRRWPDVRELVSE